MSLRLKIALGFAAVALGTAAVVSLATPPIVGRGFAQLESPLASPAADATGRGSGQGRGTGSAGAGPGPQAGIHAAQVQQDTTVTLILVAVGAALLASLVGFAAAGRMARPLTRLTRVAQAVAGGDLEQRSGLGARTDEFGEVGRSFDRMAADLQQVDEERRRFMQDAVHELRTPLTVIEGTAGAIEEGVFLPEARHMQTIREQTRLLSRIVDDLRTISLAEAGALPLDRRTVEVAELIRSVAAAFEARSTVEGIALSEEVAAGLALEADPDRLRQAIAALMDNALRHTPRGGSVALTGRRLGPNVRVSVEDSGPGIAAEDLAHVFDRLYQADPSRDRRTGTSGLGLTIARALVEANGGHVGAENRPEGGASVWVDLPAAGRSRPG